MSIFNASADPGYRDDRRLAVLLVRDSTSVTGSPNSGRGGTISPGTVGESATLLRWALGRARASADEADKVLGVGMEFWFVAIVGRFPRSMSVKSASRPAEIASTPLV
jgi:hypothetical protein